MNQWNSQSPPEEAWHDQWSNTKTGGEVAVDSAAWLLTIEISVIPTTSNLGGSSYSFCVCLSSVLSPFSPNTLLLFSSCSFSWVVFSGHHFDFLKIEKIHFWQTSFQLQWDTFLCMRKGQACYTLLWTTLGIIYLLLKVVFVFFSKFLSWLSPDHSPVFCCWWSPGISSSVSPHLSFILFLVSFLAFFLVTLLVSFLALLLGYF